MDYKINFTSKKIEYHLREDKEKNIYKPNVYNYAVNLTNTDALVGDYFQSNGTNADVKVSYSEEASKYALKYYLQNIYEKQPLQISKYATSINNKLKPKVSDDVAINTAKRITKDKDMQKMLVEFAQQEAVIIRTKKDAVPIMREQFYNLENKNNVIVLDINPQMNNGMQKSNTLISNWYVDTNAISKDNFVTLRQDELRTKSFKPADLHKDWKQGSEIAKKLEKYASKGEIISMDKVRTILDEIKGLPPEEILEIYSMRDLAATINTVNTNIVQPQKRMGYVGALVAQLEYSSKGKDEITLVIPDDCSLSGSSMLCDSVKILDKFIKNNPEKKVHVVFSPLILGDMAQTAFDRFMDKNSELDDSYFHSVSALKSDGSEAYSGIRKAFERVKNAENVTFEVTPNNLKAKHFTETDYFKNINDQVKKSKLTYLLQGPNANGYPMFGGYGGCGVLVITPTEEFELEGNTYAGKIPTNSVGFMEVLGHEMGVLNDDSNDEKGLFTKGSGRGYARYCEWSGLEKPSKQEDRIPITISKDGTIFVRK